MIRSIHTFRRSWGCNLSCIIYLHVSRFMTAYSLRATNPASWLPEFNKYDKIWFDLIKYIEPIRRMNFCVVFLNERTHLLRADLPKIAVSPLIPRTVLERMHWAKKYYSVDRDNYWYCRRFDATELSGGITAQWTEGTARRVDVVISYCCGLLYDSWSYVISFARSHVTQKAA